LEYKPCYDYLGEEEELKAREAFNKKAEKLEHTKDPALAEALAEELDNEIKKSWDNIFTVDGSRRLKVLSYPFTLPIQETFDVQAVFPMLAKRWIKDIEEVK
jgi:hypothetical protein